MLISKFNVENIEAKIEIFEKGNNITLPKQYRTFLHKYNGGFTPKTKFRIGKTSSYIEYFFGIDCKQFGFEKLEISEWIEKDILPIAVDYFGNYITIGLANNKVGKIYFSDHEKGYKTHKIGEDFSKFLRSCQSEVISDKFTKSIKEREEMLIARGRGHIITDSLRRTWQAEIDKYKNIVQEEVIID